MQTMKGRLFVLPVQQSWAAVSSRAVPSFCAPNDTVKSETKRSRFLPGLALAKIQLTVQVWSRFRWNWVCEIICLALVPKLGIAWKQILISLINRDIKSWKARCRDEWRLMRSHLAAITSNAIAVGGRRAHLAVSHTGINQEEVFWSPWIHFHLYWCDWGHSLALWGCRMINTSPKWASGYMILFFFFPCRCTAWKERRNLDHVKISNEIWRHCLLTSFLSS